MSNPSNDCARAPYFGDVIFTYTRAQALADGVLMDTGALAHEAGFRLPVAVTAAVFSECVAWNEADSLAQVHQDETGRLWDVLFMAAHAIRCEAGTGASQAFRFHRVPRDGHSVEPAPVDLKLVIGPDDDGDPVVTVMRSDED